MRVSQRLRFAVSLLLGILGMLGLLSGEGLRLNQALARSPTRNSKILRTAMGSEPQQLNSTRATNLPSFFILGHILEGLTRRGPDHTLLPGVAKSWTLKPLEAEFKLRKEARWSDGTPVVASDFVFAWRKTLEPSTASMYSFILYPLKNAEAIATGKLPSENLGVQATDEYTLKIKLEHPCPYFLSLTSLPTFFPVKELFYRQHANRYGADLNDLLYNGPFLLQSWIHGASLKMVKNPSYWNREAVHLDGIEIPYMTSDQSALFNFYRSGDIDILPQLEHDDLNHALAERFKLKRFEDGTVEFLEFNIRRDRPTRNKYFRKALALVFNSRPFVQQVVAIPGTHVAESLIPSWVKGSENTFRKEFPLSAVHPDLEKAAAYLKISLTELGLKSPPVLSWLSSDTQFALKEAEYFQQLFKSTLKIEVKIDRQIFKQKIAKMQSGQFDIASASWSPDYEDPMAFAELMASWNGNNRGQYKNDAYDALIRHAQLEPRTRDRMILIAKAEKILLDDLPILPLYEGLVLYSHSNRIEGILRSQFGTDPDYSRARIVEH